METVGIDLVSVLKTIRDASIRALQDVEGRDFVSAVANLQEIDEFIGGYKLQLMIDTLECMAKK